MAKKTGTLNRLIGWATGDRRAEAEGRVEEETGRKAEGDEVTAKENQVRAEHGDFGVPSE